MGQADDNDNLMHMTADGKKSRKKASRNVSGDSALSVPTTTDWQSFKSPATFVGKALGKIKTKNKSSSLLSGLDVRKVTRSGKIRFRVVTVSDDRFAVFCTHSKVRGGSFGAMYSAIKKPFGLSMGGSKKSDGSGGTDSDDNLRYIDVGDINYIQTAVVGTQKLESARSENRLKGRPSDIDTFKNEIITIVHHGKDSLDILVDKQDERAELVRFLKQMTTSYQSAIKWVDNESLLLRYIWFDVDANKDSMIEIKEFIKILQRINLYIKNPKRVYESFVKEHNISKKELTYQQCMHLLQNLKRKSIEDGKYPPDKIWDSVFGANVNIVQPEQFLEKFVHNVQGDRGAKITDVVMLFKMLNKLELCHIEAQDTPTGEGTLTRSRFEVFLRSVINDAYDPRKTKLKPSSLDRPMSEYWINTSHNTYLTGDQLRSYSSVEMYMNALRRGCKCLELDCWDGEKATINGKGKCIPVVFHGHTLTSKILFEDIVHGVRSYVDDNPDTYPIILSLENHCSPPFQWEMAHLLRTILGNILYEPSSDEVHEKVLLSPAKLQGKVVIKGKRPPEQDSNEGEEDKDNDDDSDDDDDGGDNTGEKKTSTTEDKKKSGGGGGHHAKTIPELGNITLFNGTKYKSWEQSLELPPAHMHSINETKILKIVKKGQDQSNLWRKYNVEHMTRTYPAGARVDSSNYNPVLAWSLGCQMVALNFQTNDTPLIINDGFYRQNGGVGYIPKPSSIMGNSSSSGTKKPDPVALKIRVLSGSCLPKPEGATTGEYIDPYVTVTVHDVKPSDKNGTDEYVETSKWTEHKDDNGFCPVWKSPGLEFTVNTPDAAMVMFTVMEKDVSFDDKVAFAAIPFRCLRKGFRSVQLYDSYNTRTGPFAFAVLLVEISY